MNIPPINIYYIPRLNKRSRYTPDLLPATISVSTKNSVVNFTNPYDWSKLLLLPSDDPNHRQAKKKYEPYRGRVRIGYYSRKHDEIICYKNKRLYLSMCSDKYRKLYYCHGFLRIN